MKRVLRGIPIPAAFLILAITGCNASDQTRGAEKPPRSETAAATDNAFAARTVVLHVSGMMKSKSGAT